VAHLAAGSPRANGPTAGRDADSGQCDATVWLHGPLERSLTGAAGGLAVPPLHRCALKPGHPGRHHALADVHGARRYWFHWDDSGFRVGAATIFARVERDSDSAEGTRQPPLSAESADTEPPTVPRRLPVHARDEALWALAAAVDRLGAVIADATSPARLRSIFGGHQPRTEPD
jgi:hypothetical protein